MVPLFEFSNVGVEVDSASILADLTVTFPRGRFTVVAGASGSGKTSLLRLCNRLDVPTGGSISFRGADLDQLDPRALRRLVGMVFQRPVLFPGTVRSNLRYANESATETAMAGTLASVELGAEFLDRVGDDLSGGEAQRVCLARALMCEPEVLLMDEPTASLHPAAVTTLEAATQRLRQDVGTEVVWVTHNLDQIGRLAEYLIVLEAGAVVYSGEPGAPAAATALATLSDKDES